METIGLWLICSSNGTVKIYVKVKSAQNSRGPPIAEIGRFATGRGRRWYDYISGYFISGSGQ